MAVTNAQSKVIETPYLRIQKNCLEIMDTYIQVSNISFFSTSEIERPNVNSFAWGLGFCFIGFLMFISGIATSFWIVLFGLVLLAVGVLIIKAWRNETKIAGISRRLTIVTNSGQSYSIVFKNQDFLKEVVSVMSDIIRDPEHERSVNINIHDCTFSGNNIEIRTIYEISNNDFLQIEKELQDIKATLKQGTLQYNAVTELQNDVNQRDINSINSSIKSFATQFSSATLANLAGACLSKLIGL